MLIFSKTSDYLANVIKSSKMSLLYRQYKSTRLENGAYVWIIRTNFSIYLDFFPILISENGLRVKYRSIQIQINLLCVLHEFVVTNVFPDSGFYLGRKINCKVCKLDYTDVWDFIAWFISRKISENFIEYRYIEL